MILFYAILIKNEWVTAIKRGIYMKWAFYLTPKSDRFCLSVCLICRSLFFELLIVNKVIVGQITKRLKQGFLYMCGNYKNKTKMAAYKKNVVTCVLVMFFTCSFSLFAAEVGKNSNAALLQQGDMYYADGQARYRILTESYPPFNYEENGKLTGISTEIVMEILKILKWEDASIEILPWDIAYKTTLNEPNAILYSLTKTPSRENQFNWVGPIATNYWNLYSLKTIEGKELDFEIRSLEDAHRYSVGAQWKGAIANYLETQGFKHLNYSKKIEEEVQELLDFKIQLAGVSELVLYSVLRQKGMAPDKVKCVFNLKHSYLYIGFNKKVPNEIIQQFKNALNEIKQSGKYDEIMNKYYDKYLSGKKKKDSTK